jgi:hypothetical protein
MHGHDAVNCAVGATPMQTLAALGTCGATKCAYTRSMVEEMSSPRPIDQCLQEFCCREDQQILIFPDEMLRRRIETALGERAGLKPTVLSGATAKGAVYELPRRCIAANRRTFAQQTIAAIEQLASELRTARARSFELAFKNASGPVNPQNDKIIVGVRYVV